MQIFARFTQNCQQGQCTKINPTGTKVTSKEKKKNKFGVNSIPNDLEGDKRSKRRYPESTCYCPLHGYSIKPPHTPVSCTNPKSFHNKVATINNRMGGVSTNYHFYTAPFLSNSKHISSTVALPQPCSDVKRNLKNKINSSAQSYTFLRKIICFLKVNFTLRNLCLHSWQTLCKRVTLICFLQRCWHLGLCCLPSLPT